jgi:hypothetical protein
MLVDHSTLFNALSFLADALDRTAQEHMSFSEVLSIQVADDLRALEKKKDETRKKVLSLTLPISLTSNLTALICVA